MHWFEALALVFCIFATLVHVITLSLTSWRCAPFRRTRFSTPGFRPPISIVRPMRGIDQYDSDTLRSGFELDYPNYELILCCEDADDPAVGVAQSLIAEYPSVSARLLIGPDKTTANPKLNNIFKGWDAARHDWIVLSDCNVLMPPNYLDRLLHAWRPDTGLVCSPPLGGRADGFWAELECAFLNTYQARWQYAADTCGLGFAQGKTMLWKRAILDGAGGIRALGAEIAEDAAATKIVREKGLRVRLVDGPFEQPLGHRTLSQVWARQVRWARLRRVTFAAFFIPELFAGSLFPILAGAIGAGRVGISAFNAVVALVALWFGAEALSSRISGWRVNASLLLASVLRDLMLPVLWVDAWISDSFVWRGNEMNVADPSKLVTEES